MALAAALVAAAVPSALAQEVDPELPVDGRDDAVVVAVIDNAFTPYHWDFLASKMPQHQDEDPENDLPLTEAPDTWLPGFPSPEEFASYRRLDLTLEDTLAGRSIASLDAADSAVWNTVQQSTPGNINYHWIPGTKAIGALTFSGGKIHGTGTSHGIGTSSVSVGNRFGTCPECLVVFIQYGGEANGERAIEWAMSQPWIDVVTNSYGFSQVERDRLYSGSDTEAQRTASERGQTILFSAGNGITNTFTIPNSTLFSSQEGPDWIVTVGAVHPTSGGSYTGHGKPADVAGVGGGYPSSYGAATVGGNGQGFGGTSNATPQVAGAYSRALYLARMGLEGPSRAQEDGVIAVGEEPFACGEARPDCELGDGVLTAKELRTRVLHAAQRTPAGMTVGGLHDPAPAVGEDELLNEGHGSFFGRLRGWDSYLTEFDRIWGPMEGTAEPTARPSGEREWMVVDSFCRQEIWGDWNGGYFRQGSTPLPGPDPLFPLRTGLEQACPALFPPV